MDELQLQPNESVMLQETGVLCKGMSKNYSDELYLTNLNLILVREVKSGLFSKSKVIRNWERIIFKSYSRIAIAS